MFEEAVREKGQDSSQRERTAGESTAHDECSGTPAELRSVRAERSGAVTERSAAPGEQPRFHADRDQGEREQMGAELKR